MRSERLAAARQRARGRVERPLAPEVDLALFSPAEREALFSGNAKLEAQRRPPGLACDASVLSEAERRAAAKYLTRGRFGVWRPEFAGMTDAEVRVALEQQ